MPLVKFHNRMGTTPTSAATFRRWIMRTLEDSLELSGVASLEFAGSLDPVSVVGGPGGGQVP